MHNPRIAPIVLAIGGHDPSGGAGIQADIETLVAHRCHTLSVVTALTTQNTCGMVQIHTQTATQVDAQCRLLLEESQVKVIKIGLLGSPHIVKVIVKILEDFPTLQTVLDPVLAVGNDGKSLVDTALKTAILEQLFPYCIIVTPNSSEARTLGGHGDLARCADSLIDRGAAAVLITGTHELSHKVVNRLYSIAGLVHEYSWPRLPGSYHGSGCTLTSAIAARLAWGTPLVTAVQQAQSYTWQTLQQAIYRGKCQLIPNRFYVNKRR